MCELGPVRTKNTEASSYSIAAAGVAYLFCPARELKKEIAQRGLCTLRGRQREGLNKSMLVLRLFEQSSASMYAYGS